MTQEKKVITLKGKYGRTQGSLLLNPVRDETTGKYLGVKELTEDEKRLEVRVVLPDTQRKISHGMTLNLSNKVDATDWEWIKHNKEIAASRADANDDPQALFYIDEPDLELDKKLKKADLAWEAQSIVRSCSQIEREELCRLLGQNVEAYRPKDIMEYLLARVEASPDKIINAKKDPNYKTKLFLFSLVDKNIVKKDKNGMFKYGDIILGLNAENAIQWLNDPRNKALVAKFYGETRAGKAIPAGSIIDELEQDENLVEDNAGGQSGEATEVE